MIDLINTDTPRVFGCVGFLLCSSLRLIKANTPEVRYKLETGVKTRSELTAGLLMKHMTKLSFLRVSGCFQWANKKSTIRAFFMAQNQNEDLTNQISCGVGKAALRVFFFFFGEVCWIKY